MGTARIFAAFIALIAATASAQGTVDYQPGFHQALRWDIPLSTLTTFRIRVPVARAGGKLKLSFRAGDSAMTLSSVNVARAGVNGALAGPATAVKFNGQNVISTGPRARVTSDPVAFQVARGEELYVSFSAVGSVSTSAILAFPKSYAWTTAQPTSVTAPPVGSEWYRDVGLATIEVEGPLDRAFVAIGDSITEGYVDGNVWSFTGRHDDVRNSWPAVAERIVGVPFANAAVSGQGLDAALLNLDAEVKVLQNITDCALLIGTNDLVAYTNAQIEAKLALLISRLQPFCRVWVGTLLPKEDRGDGQYAAVVQSRLQVNSWIRAGNGAAGVIDFEPVLADGADINSFGPGYNADAVHPSILGLKKLGEFAAAWFGAPQVTNRVFGSGPTAGGTQVTISGTGFRPGLKVYFDGAPATITGSTATQIRLSTPAHAFGSVEVEIRNADGTSLKVADAFRYDPEGIVAKPTLQPLVVAEKREQAVSAEVTQPVEAPVAQEEEAPRGEETAGCSTGMGGGPGLSVLAAISMFVANRRRRGVELGR